MFRVILEERKRRELDPTIQVVQECVEEAKRFGAADLAVRERMEHLLEFMLSMSELYEEFRRLPPATARKLLKFRGKVKKILGS